MRLFSLNKDTYTVEIDEGALLLAPFRVIWNRDRSMKKDKALNELAYIYFMCDNKSDYRIQSDLNLRSEDIIKDLRLKDWKPDKKIEDAMEFYREKSVTMLTKMFDSAMAGANAVNEMLQSSGEYVKNSSNPIKAAKDVIDTLNKIPKAMADLKAAEKELIQEAKNTDDRTKGSQKLNMFEDGL